MFKVSVIIPTYNRRSFLSNAIDSVLNQSYQDLELILDLGQNKFYTQFLYDIS